MALPAITNPSHYAREMLLESVTQRTFKHCTLLAALMGRSRQEARLGAQGQGEWLNPAVDDMGAIDRSKVEAFGRYTSGKFLTTDSGGTAALQYGGTLPDVSTASDDLIRTYVFYSYRQSTPMKINNIVLERNKGQAAWGSVMRDAVDVAMQGHLDSIATSLYAQSNTQPTPSGNGYTQSRMSSLYDALGSTATTYGMIDKSTYTTWAGQKESSNFTASIDNIANIPLEYNLSDYYDEGGLLFITDNTSFQSIQSEVVNVTVQNIQWDVPLFGKYGIRKPLVQCGSVWATYDPYMSASDAYCLSLRDWHMGICESANFKIWDFSKPNRPGDVDAIYSWLVSDIAFFCANPGQSVFFDAVVT